MRTRAFTILTVAAALGSLAASLSSCGSSTFDSGGDSGTDGEGAADVVHDSVIVAHPDGPAGDDGGPIGDAGSGGHDALFDGAAADHEAPPSDAAPESALDTGSEGGTDATTPTDAAGGEASSGSDASTGITVSGHAVSLGSRALLSFGPTALAFREVGIRDATGKLVTTNTDANGAFQLAGITTPYDVVVYPGSPSDPPYVYLGLSTPQPQLAGAVTLTRRDATINVSIQFQNCSASSCQCSATYWLRELSTYISEGCGPFNANQLTVSLNPDVAWMGPSSVTADLQVLEWDPQAQHFWHGVASGISLTGGLTTTVPTIVVSSVPTAGTLTVTATAGAGVPTTWPQQASLLFSYPNNDGFAIVASDATLPLMSGFPNIAGATVTAGVSASDPAGTLLTGSFTSAGASNLPLSTTSVAVTLKPPPTVTSPTNNGSLSKTGVIAWSSTSTQQMYRAILVPYVEGDAGPVFNGNVAAIVYTSGSSVDLAGLNALGVNMGLGTMQLQLWGAGMVASLDAMVDEQTLAQPDGSQSYAVYVPFTVTP
jgi:hypothetical protein